MALLKFKKGEFKDLPLKKSEGTVYITTDEKAMYVDINDDERIRIGQIITLESEDLTPPYREDSFYYLTDINALVRWNGSKWVQLNSTEELSTRISALETTVGDSTKGLVKDVSGLNTRMTAAEGKITTLQGDLKNIQDTRLTDVQVNGKTVVEGTVATLGELATKDKISTTDIDTAFNTKLQGYDTNIGAHATRLTNLESKDTTIEGNITTINGTLTSHDNRITQAQTDATQGINDAATAQSKADEAFSKAGANATAIGGLTNRVKTIEDTYATDAEVEAIKTALEEDIADNAETLSAHDTRITAAKKAGDDAMAKATGNATTIASLNTSVQNLANNKVDNTTYNTKIEELEGDISDNATAASNAQSRADAAYSYANTNKGLIDGHLTRIVAIEGTLDKVTNVMDFLGVAKVAPTSASVTLIDDTVISTLHKGDVVIFGNKEYVYDGSQWVEFGDASVNASEISALTGRVTANEGNITDLQERMTAAEGTIGAHTTQIAARYTKDETDAAINAALTWGTFK